MRLVHGAAFHGFFYIYYGGETDNRNVWYECETCIVTNVAITGHTHPAGAQPRSTL